MKRINNTDLTKVQDILASINVVCPTREGHALENANIYITTLYGSLGDDMYKVSYRK